jgi:hypothetical protein
MRRATFVTAAFACLMLAASDGSAQVSLDEIEEAVGGRLGDYERVEQLLGHPDRNRAMAAMELLLASGDPTYVRMAREFGLYSSDPNVRQLALRAVLDAGGAFRLVIDPPSENSTDTRRAASAFGGSVSDEGRVSIPFQVKSGGFNQTESCWSDMRGSCTLRATGSTVHLTSWRQSNVTLTGEFSLDDSGTLVGHILANSQGNPVRAAIPMLD